MRIKTFRKSQDGQALTEYAGLIALIGAALVGVSLIFGPTLLGKLVELSDNWGSDQNQPEYTRPGENNGIEGGNDWDIEEFDPSSPTPDGSTNIHPGYSRYVDGLEQFTVARNGSAVNSEFCAPSSWSERYLNVAIDPADNDTIYCINTRSGAIFRSQLSTGAAGTTLFSNSNAGFLYNYGFNSVSIFRSNPGSTMTNFYVRHSQVVDGVIYMLLWYTNETRVNASLFKQQSDFLTTTIPYKSLIVGVDTNDLARGYFVHSRNTIMDIGADGNTSTTNIFRNFDYYNGYFIASSWYGNKAIYNIAQRRWTVWAKQDQSSGGAYRGSTMVNGTMLGIYNDSSAQSMSAFRGVVAVSDWDEGRGDCKDFALDEKMPVNSLSNGNEVYGITNYRGNLVASKFMTTSDNNPTNMHWYDFKNNTWRQFTNKGTKGMKLSGYIRHSDEILLSASDDHTKLYMGIFENNWN